MQGMRSAWKTRDPKPLGGARQSGNSSGPRIPQEEWPLGDDAGKWGRGKSKCRDWLSKGREAEEHSHERKKVRKSIWRSVMLGKR